MNSLCLQRSAIWTSEKVACQFNWGRSYLIFLYTGIVFNKTTYAYNTAMADVSRLLEVGSREYIQWILKSVSSCLEGRGGTLQHTHMFLKCSNVLLFYCRCITEMKFNNLLYTIPIKRKDSLPWRSWTKYKLEAVQRAAAPCADTPPPPRFTPSLSAVTIPSFLLFTMKRWAAHKKRRKKANPRSALQDIEERVADQIQENQEEHLNARGSTRAFTGEVSEMQEAPVWCYQSYFCNSYSLAA